MSNSMSLEKIFIIMAIILGLSSTLDLIYALITLSFIPDQVLRSVLNIIVAALLYRYFRKKQRIKLAQEHNQLKVD